MGWDVVGHKLGQVWDAFIGNGSWSEVSPYLRDPAPTALGVMGGCAAAAPSSRFEPAPPAKEQWEDRGAFWAWCKEPAAGSTTRTPFNDIILVDNGDGIFSLNCPYDSITDKEGNKLSLANPSVAAFLNRSGMDKERAPVVVLSELGNMVSAADAGIQGIKAATDEEAAWQRYEAIECAARRAEIPSYIGSPLYRRVLAESGRMSYVIPLGLARWPLEHGFLDDGIAALADAQKAAAQNGVPDVQIRSRMDALLMTAFRRAISNIEAGSAQYGYVDGANSGLDDILAKAKGCGMSGAIEAEVRRMRVEAYMTAIRQVANGAAARGYVYGINERFKELEESAAKYQLLPDIEAELTKTKKDGYFKAILDAEVDFARKGYLTPANDTLDYLLEKAKECGIQAAIEGEVRRVRVMGHMAAIRDVAKGMSGMLALIEQSARRYGIFDDVKDEIQRARALGNANSRKK